MVTRAIRKPEVRTFTDKFAWFLETVSVPPRRCYAMY